MVRVAYAAMLVLAGTLPISATLASDPSHVVIDKNCVVTRYYGVPLNLKHSELRALKIDHTRGYVSGEGDYYPAATLLVGNNVLLQLEFAADKESLLYQVRTSSPGAIGPRGIAIGATLKEVQRKWPEGKLYWSVAHGPYVAFTNGTNVFFEFDPADMPPNAFDDPPVPKQTATGEWIAPHVVKVKPDPEKLRVSQIRISALDFNYTCPNSRRKTN